jgi:hypothetical protein
MHLHAMPHLMLRLRLGVREGSGAGEGQASRPVPSGPAKHAGPAGSTGKLPDPWPSTSTSSAALLGTLGVASRPLKICRRGSSSTSSGPLPPRGP